MVSSDDKFTQEFIHKVRVKGFSRIPIYLGSDKMKIMGSFNTKCILKYSE
jgi:CBS domain containing-hemolysin-like protein